MRRANLTGANLSGTRLIRTDFRKARLDGCRVFGLSAWDVDTRKADQTSLRITRTDQPTITVDNLEMAQFMYLLLNNRQIRDAIDTITSKVVLILGRFTPTRKPVLDVIREELRARGYVPVLFDFDKPASRDFTETVSTLAHLAAFIVADLTEPRSVPHELQAITPNLAVPLVPIIEGRRRPYALFADIAWKYPWVLEIRRYRDLTDLKSWMSDLVLDAEAKARELKA